MHPPPPHTAGFAVQGHRARVRSEELQVNVPKVAATVATPSPRRSPAPTPEDLLARAKYALQPFLCSEESASYLLDTSSAYPLQALSNPALAQSAITSSHSESMLSLIASQDFDVSSQDFSIASESIVVPQVTFGGTYFGITVVRHARIPTASPTTAEASLPEPELSIGRFAGKLTFWQVTSFA